MPAYIPHPVQTNQMKHISRIVLFNNSLRRILFVWYVLHLPVLQLHNWPCLPVSVRWMFPVRILPISIPAVIPNSVWRSAVWITAAQAFIVQKTAQKSDMVLKLPGFPSLGIRFWTFSTATRWVNSVRPTHWLQDMNSLPVFLTRQVWTASAPHFAIFLPHCRNIRKSRTQKRSTQPFVLICRFFWIFSMITQSGYRISRMRWQMASSPMMLPTSIRCWKISQSSIKTLKTVRCSEIRLLNFRIREMIFWISLQVISRSL